MSKKIIVSIFILSSISFSILAQNPLDAAKSSATKAVPSTASLGSVLKDLEGGLKPESLLPSFNSSDFLKSASSLKSTDIAGASSLLGKLGSGLNPSSLVKGFSMKDWSSKLKSATTMSALSKEAESLVKNISPSAFKSGFDVSKITSSLGMLSAMK